MAVSWVALGASNSVRQWTAYRSVAQGDILQVARKPVYDPGNYIDFTRQHDLWYNAPLVDQFAKERKSYDPSETFATWWAGESAPSFPYRFPQGLGKVPEFDNDAAPTFLYDPLTYGGWLRGYCPNGMGGPRQELPISAALDASVISDIADCVYPDPVAFANPAGQIPIYINPSTGFAAPQTQAGNSRGHQGHGFWTDAEPTHPRLVMAPQPDLFTPRPVITEIVAAYRLQRHSILVATGQGTTQRVTMTHFGPQHSYGLRNAAGTTLRYRGWYAWDGANSRWLVSLDYPCENRWRYRVFGDVYGVSGTTAYGLPATIRARALYPQSAFADDYGETYIAKTYVVLVAYDETETRQLIDTTTLSYHEPDGTRYHWLDETITPPTIDLSAAKGFRLEIEVEKSSDGTDVTDDDDWVIYCHAKAPCCASPWAQWSDPDTGSPYCPGWWMYEPA